MAAVLPQVESVKSGQEASGASLQNGGGFAAG